MMCERKLRFPQTAALLVALLVLSACGSQSAPTPAAPAPTAAPAAKMTPASPTVPPASTPAKITTPAVGQSKVKQPIMFAGLDWDSAAVHNAIARHIIEKGYGYQTDQIPGSTIPMTQGLIRGDVQVYIEAWQDNMPKDFFTALQNGTIKNLGVNFNDATQGWYVPAYVVKGDPARGIKPVAPDLKSVNDMPKYWQQFKDAEDPGKGRFYDCIAGWECEKVNEKKFKAYDLDKTFNRFHPGTGAALDTSIVSAYKQGKPWIGYYWAPTWIVGKYDMFQLEEPKNTKECWDSHKGCAYPVSTVTVTVHKDLNNSAPDVAAFFARYNTSSKLTGELLAYMEDNKARPEAAAAHFLKTRESVWGKWVPAEVATKIKASFQ